MEKWLKIEKIMGITLGIKVLVGIKVETQFFRIPIIGVVEHVSGVAPQEPEKERGR